LNAPNNPEFKQGAIRVTDGYHPRFARLRLLNPMLHHEYLPAHEAGKRLAKSSVNDHHILKLTGGAPGTHER
jgi:hypothetical protein